MLKKDVLSQHLRIVAEHAIESNWQRDLVLKAQDKALLEVALEACKGNLCRAARMLGIHRNTFTRQAGELKIDVRKFRPQPNPMHRKHYLNRISA